MADTKHIDSDSSSDQFTDASEGRNPNPNHNPKYTPVPMTRVERVDEEPSYGEKPGTDAYKKRTFDAVPDEIGVQTRSRSASVINTSVSPTPKPDIPLIIATKVDPDHLSHGEVPGTEAFEKRKADAQPDVIVKSPDGSEASSSFRESPTFPNDRFPNPTESSTKFDSQQPLEHDADDEEEEDPFDDFEEAQIAEDDDDFGDFDEGVSVNPSQLPTICLDWADIDGIEDINSYITNLFSQVEDKFSNASTTTTPPPNKFLSDRSLSLYSQLVAPPPLAPPNWLRSRIRRLFLVSLGVPIDLDEILPASKQKKLILPSVHSPRASGEFGATHGAISRLKEENNSNASVDSISSKRKQKRKDDDLEPDFNVSEALRIANTTQSRLEGLEDSELKQHVVLLESFQKRGQEALEYWSNRKEGAIREKEAFEGVIENLVKHARKVRK